jgi:hypothetical protein
MTEAGSDPTLGEVARRLDDARRDIRDDIADMRQQHDRDLHAIYQRLDLFVTRDLYEAERGAMRDRLDRIEKDAERARGSTRWALNLALSSFVAPIIVAIVLALVLKGS